MMHDAPAPGPDRGPDSHGREILRKYSTIFPGLESVHDQLHEVLQPADFLEQCDLREIALVLARLRQSRRSLEELEEMLILAVKENWWHAQEQRLARARAMLAQDPSAAVAELEAFSLGCSWLIDCWRRLEALIVREQAWAGFHQFAARAERPPGARLDDRESEYLAWAYDLLAREDAGETQVVAFYVLCNLAPDAIAPPPLGTLPARAECRQRARAVAARTLPRLRAWYRYWLIEHEEAALEAARGQAFEENPGRAIALRYSTAHTAMFRTLYKRLVPTRKLLPLADPQLAAEIEALLPRRKSRRKPA
jgi:hypothetical protein